MGKDKKKHKRKSGTHKKHKKSKQASSSRESSSGEEWVECHTPSSRPNGPPSSATPAAPEHRLLADAVSEQDDWVTNPALSACVSRHELRRNNEKNKEKNERDKYMLDKLGQTDRELNPYWRDGGSGLPEENPATVESLRQSFTTVGDQGAAWLRKALQRATEQAQESRRPLEEVVAERWGSLEKLKSMIVAAEERDENKKLSLKADKPRHYKDEYRDRKSSHNRRDECYHNRERSTSQNRDSKRSFARPHSSSDDSSDGGNRYRHKKTLGIKDEKLTLDNERKRNENLEKRFKSAKGSSESDSSSGSNNRRIGKVTNQKLNEKSHSKFSKHRDSSSSSTSSDEDYRSRSEKHVNKRYEKERKPKNSNRGFSKPVNSSDEDLRGSKSQDYNRKFVKPRCENEEHFDRTPRNNKSYSSVKGGWKKKVDPQTKGKELDNKNNSETEKHADTGCNEIQENNKAVEPEEEPILTDKELNELAAKLVKSELLGDQEMTDKLKAKLDKARQAKASAPKEGREGKQEVIVLTHTDAKGFTRPVSFSGPSEPSGGRRKSHKVETHAGGKRMRYFADDDKYSLQEMFQREKLNTVENSNEVFAKLASKGIGRDDSARDMEDVFEETARVEVSQGRDQVRERQKAVEQSRRTARTLDTCQWCLESQHMLKHLIVAIGKTCYLCVPPYQSLTDHHCLIVPQAHTPCATQLDEDVWTEIQDMRKAVVDMFLSQDEDVVFFESARRLNQFPHMVLNCVPVPKETGDMAPIYFKKAIQECEMEWSNNKKLVDLKGRDVRKAVPRGLPYFAVDFGMDSGYAHVIEDEQLFPLNFAQEIIGGMLDLDHSIWRKQRRQTFEEQSKKVIQLGKLWSPFDITKKK